MNRSLSRGLLATFLCLLAAVCVCAESPVEAQQRHVLALNQKLVEMRARLKEAAPELAEIETVVRAQEKYLDELRAATHEHLQTRLDEVEKELAGLRDAQARADPVREALLEQARGELLRKLLEYRLGIELEKDTPKLPATPVGAAAAEAIRAGAISFRIPDVATPAAVDGIMKQIAKIAPNVQVTYLFQLRVITASGGDVAQLRRVQGLVDAIKEARPVAIANNPGAEAVRPPRPPAEIPPRKAPQEQF